MSGKFWRRITRNVQPEPRTRAIWARERAAQIDWAEEQSMLWQRNPDGPVQWPGGPYSRPCPPMTAPPPFSPQERTDPRNRP